MLLRHLAFSAKIGIMLNTVVREASVRFGVNGEAVRLVSINTLLDYSILHIQRLAIRWALGCVNPASWLPLAAGASSRNLVPTF